MFANHIGLDERFIEENNIDGCGIFVFAFETRNHSLKLNLFNVCYVQTKANKKGVNKNFTALTA